MVKYSGSYELAFFNENLHSSRKHPKSDSLCRWWTLLLQKMPKKRLYMSVMKSHIQECQKELLRRWWSLYFFNLKSLWNYSCYAIPGVVCIPQQKDSSSRDFPKNGLLNAWQFKNVIGNNFLACTMVMLPHMRLFSKPSWCHVPEENGSFSKVSSSCLMHVSISPSACVIAIQNARASNLLESSRSHAWRSKLKQIFHHEWKKCPSMHSLDRKSVV